MAVFAAHLILFLLVLGYCLGEKFYLTMRARGYEKLLRSAKAIPPLFIG